jgi:PadR family transcriptional regulator PadR
MLLGIEKELLKGHIDIVILALLYDGDIYGYELAKRVKKQTDNQFELKEGTLYLAFKRLEEGGLVESYWGDESEGGRRKYYRLLAKGKIHLLEAKKAWEQLRKIMDVFLRKVDANEKKQSQQNDAEENRRTRRTGGKKSGA